MALELQPCRAEGPPGGAGLCWWLPVKARGPHWASGVRELDQVQAAQESPRQANEAECVFPITHFLKETLLNKKPIEMEINPYWFSSPLKKKILHDWDMCAY